MIWDDVTCWNHNFHKLKLLHEVCDNIQLRRCILGKWRRQWVALKRSHLSTNNFNFQMSLSFWFFLCSFFLNLHCVNNYSTFKVFFHPPFSMRRDFLVIWILIGRFFFWNHIDSWNVSFSCIQHAFANTRLRSFIDIIWLIDELGALLISINLDRLLKITYFRWQLVVF